LLVIVRFGIPERWGAVFACNAMLLYSVTSAIWLLPLAIFTRRRDTWLTVAASAAIWLVLWGGLFAPTGKREPPSGPRVRVMSYNVLGFNFDTASLVRILRESAPDIAVLPRSRCEARP
jgi:hypothetical protein